MTEQRNNENIKLFKENAKAMKKANLLLQMPPFMAPRQKQTEILSQDERLNPLNLKNTKYMFIDISLNIPDHVSTFFLNIRKKEGGV
jgi:hypothetical protein